MMYVTLWMLLELLGDYHIVLVEYQSYVTNLLVSHYTCCINLTLYDWLMLTALSDLPVILTMELRMVLRMEGIQMDY